MGDIIKESGLSAGAIYGYYSGKDELVADLAQTVLGERSALLDAMMSRSPMPSPATMLRDLVATLPEEFLADGLLLQFWSGIGADGNLRQMAQDNLGWILGQLEDYLTAWRREHGDDEAVARASAARLAPVLGGIIQGFILQVGIRGDALDRDAFLDAAAAVLDGALAA